MTARDIVVVDDRYYILATSPQLDQRARVLKHGDSFGVFDQAGSIRPLGLGEEGLYCRGTRHLSRFELALDDTAPLLLSSTVRDDNALLGVDLTNADIVRHGEVVLPRNTLHIFRCTLLHENACHVRFRLRSYGDAPARLPVRLHFGADFRDIFEIRGQQRQERGELLEPVVDDRSIRFGYRGLDDVERTTQVTLDVAPTRIASDEIALDLELGPGEERVFRVIASFERDDRGQWPAFEQVLSAVHDDLTDRTGHAAGVLTSNEQMNDWVKRSAADVHLMVTETAHGPYPYAGIPWYNTPFGRDGLVTALECCWLAPDIARGVLEYLARTQATEHDPENDAEPGKILHEHREGEMAALGEVPFGRYYGTVDATPLFVMLAGSYYRRTADRETLESIWPNLERALAWIDTHGDADDDGFVEYACHSSRGLTSQGWKDSVDSVFHADGTLADGPIALAEVQGYVHAAKRAAARLATALGYDARAEALRAEAEALRARFESAFWCEDLGTYALALDGEKRPCRVRASNAGHCLFTGIASRERAARTAATLTSPTHFSGWGIRTVASTESRYNPMSYHNGSIWPHDNALVAAGFARYGLNDALLRVTTGLFDASLFVELERMPELFCGFDRRHGEGPTLYPVACSPQSWAAASVFLLLASCMGLRIDAPARRVALVRPVLPPWLDRVEVDDLRVRDGCVSFAVERHRRDVAVTLLAREGDIEVTIVK